MKTLSKMCNGFVKNICNAIFSLTRLTIRIHYHTALKILYSVQRNLWGQFLFDRQRFVCSPHYRQFFACWLLVLVNWLVNITETYVPILPIRHRCRRFRLKRFSACLRVVCHFSPSPCKHSLLNGLINFKVSYRYVRVFLCLIYGPGYQISTTDVIKIIVHKRLIFLLNNLSLVLWIQLILHQIMEPKILHLDIHQIMKDFCNGK